MTCQEFAERLYDYAAAAVDAERRADAERHLDGCARCPGYLHEYLSAVRLARVAFSSSENRVSREGCFDE